MKKGAAIAIVVVAVIAVLGIGLASYLIGTYNDMVRSQEDVNNKWAQVENQLQRRADLIPNLVETVKGYASQEETIFTEVARLRSSWNQAKDSGNIEDQIEAANNLESGLSRLLVVVESYPELKSDQSFLKLQDQLEGTENRIAVERKRYNDEVTVFNKKIKTFPRSFLASLFGFEEFEYFEIDESAKEVPDVQF
jgi:LemA protein